MEKLRILPVRYVLTSRSNVPRERSLNGLKLARPRGRSDSSVEDSDSSRCSRSVSSCGATSYSQRRLVATSSPPYGPIAAVYLFITIISSRYRSASVSSGALFQTKHPLEYYDLFTNLYLREETASNQTPWSTNCRGFATAVLLNVFRVFA